MYVNFTKIHLKDINGEVQEVNFAEQLATSSI